MDEVELAERLSDHKHRIGSLEHRMEKAEGLIDVVHEVATSVQLLAQESKSTGKKIDNLTEKVETLENRPADEWSKVKLAAITAVITAILSAAVAAIINIL